MFVTPALALISSCKIYAILFIPTIHLNIINYVLSIKFCAAFLNGTSTLVRILIIGLTDRTGSHSIMFIRLTGLHTIPLKTTHHSKWSAVAQWVDLPDSRNQESMCSNTLCYRSEVEIFTFSPRRPSSLSCIHYDLTIDSDGNGNELSSHAIAAWLECFPDKSSWCRN